MHPQVAANKLLDRLHLPARAATIWPWHDDGDVILIVKIAPEYRSALKKVPKRYYGYQVQVETRTPPEAKLAGCIFRSNVNIDSGGR